MIKRRSKKVVTEIAQTAKEENVAAVEAQEVAPKEEVKPETNKEVVRKEKPAPLFEQPGTNNQKRVVIE